MPASSARIPLHSALSSLAPTLVDGVERIVFAVDTLGAGRWTSEAVSGWLGKFGEISGRREERCITVSCGASVRIER